MSKQKRKIETSKAKSEVDCLVTLPSETPCKYCKNYEDMKLEKFTQIDFYYTVNRPYEMEGYGEYECPKCKRKFHYSYQYNEGSGHDCSFYPIEN